MAKRSIVEEIYAANKGISLWWLGQAGFAAKFDEVLVFIDPVIELERDEERIFINVREPLVNSDKGAFIAVPSLITHECSNTDFVGLGNSVEEALKDCLKRIKGMPLRQIIPE